MGWFYLASAYSFRGELRLYGEGGGTICEKVEEGAKRLTLNQEQAYRRQHQDPDCFRTRKGLMWAVWNLENRVHLDDAVKVSQSRRPDSVLLLTADHTWTVGFLTLHLPPETPFRRDLFDHLDTR